jgi:alkylation response protein AidB-like acyl-CoA dehydrogenase
MYRLTPDQQSIVARAIQIADDTIAANARVADAEARYPRASMDALGAAGFLGLTVAAEHGGMGQGPRVVCAVLDEIAQRCGSTAMCFNMHLAALAAYQAAVHPPVEELRAAARGDHVATLAFSEFGSRSHFWALVSQERRDNGRVVLNASKSFVTSAGEADGYVVSTRWSEGKAPTDSMLYLVLASDVGLGVAGTWDALGLRANASAPMTLREVALPATRALTAPGQGMAMMLGSVLPIFNVGSAAISIGIAEVATRITQRHLTTNAFDYNATRLSDLPNERARLAEMRIDTDRARAYLAATLDALEQPGDSTMLHVLASKAAAAETAIAVTDTALRACGGTGFTRTLGLERAFRDARAAAVMAPTTDVLHEFVGRALCGMELL